MLVSAFPLFSSFSPAAPTAAFARAGRSLRARGRLITAAGLALIVANCGSLPAPPLSQMSASAGHGSVTVEFSDRYQAVAAPIQLWTRSWVTHVDFVLPDGRLLGATPTGVRIRNWTPALHSVRYSFNADPQRVLGFALAQVGKPYDYGGNLAYVLKIGALNSKDSWFCSELVEAAALAGGVDLSGKAPRWTSPARLKASPLLQPINTTPQPDSPRVAELAIP